MRWDGKKGLCVDFDGVIHLYESGWKDIDVIEDNPHEDAWRALGEYVETFRVFIYSARSSEERGIAAMKVWFKKHSCPEHIYEKLIFTNIKPAASIYLDDRGWCFTGAFPSVAELVAFKPWNKK